ncbi:MAG: hypothetical protein LBU27_08850 [Candidatus Peribacteria bacterium]|jgi:ABC-type transporter Mla subunit MlaD|nr:hypothetical protein [Candidatus Peribacteria bacterium]
MKNALSAGLGNILSQVANNISSFFKNALNKSIELSDQLERNKIAFTTMLGGDENEANKFLNQLDTFSNKYAKNRQEVRENAKQMMAMGVKYEKVIPTMKAL